MTEDLGHSPLGASGSHRWMECPGSVGLSYGVDDEEDDTFSKPGQVAHAVGEACLLNAGEAWMLLDEEIEGLRVDVEMANAVQVYLDAVRTWHPKRDIGVSAFAEYRFKATTLHNYFWGTSDFVCIEGRVLHIWDFKYGAGIVVEVENNPQLKYYACGVLETMGLWDQVDRVVLHIAQPRAYLPPIRDWEIDVVDLDQWLFDTLIPAMDNALVSRETKSGEHCRFCPARFRACPQLMADMDELERMLKVQLKKRTAAQLKPEELSRLLDLVDLAKIVGKAATASAFNRLNSGAKVPGRKLAKAKASRVWKKGAEAALKKEFGKHAMTEPELKSPAQIEELPKGKAFVARWAEKPDAGLTLVKDDDMRPAISKDTKSLFSPVPKGQRK